MGIFKNVQVDLKAPKGVLIDKSMIKHESLTLAGASTPLTEQIMIYAQKHMLPNELEIEATVTYQQIKDVNKLLNSGSMGGMLRTNQTSVKVPTSLFLTVIEPSKDSQPCQITLNMQGINTLGSLPEAF